MSIFFLYRKERTKEEFEHNVHVPRKNLTIISALQIIYRTDNLSTERIEFFLMILILENLSVLARIVFESLC